MSDFETGRVSGTSKVSLAEGDTRTGLSLAAFEADVSVAVSDEGEFAEGF